MKKRLVTWETYNDIAPILKIIEGRAGILVLLNEKCMLPKSNPEHFVRKVLEQHEASPHSEIAPRDKATFRVHHYAGPMEYNRQLHRSQTRCSSVGPQEMRRKFH
jgi:myosin heavy subunit